MSPFLRYILSSLFSTLFFSLFFSYLIMQIISFNVLGRGNRKGMLKKLFKNKDMLCLFLFIYFTFAVFFITVIQRECTYTPLANVFRGLSIYNDNHAIDYQVIGNILMFIPSSFLLCILMREEGSFVKIILKTLLSSLCFSTFIEITQLIFSKGTFQFSDIVYNTLGGVLGALIFIIINLIIEKKRSK